MQNVIAINAAAHHSIIAAQATSDEMLLESIADGGRTAMHILYSRHNVRVYRFVLRMVRDATTPEASLDRSNTSAILRACVAKLSPAHREIINLVYYHEKSVEEVGRIIGVPQSTVK